MRVERLSWLLPDCGELARLKQAEPDLIIYFGSRASLASGAAEISPHAVSGICELHNQTMTITTITELAA